jgi:predicted TIM-barrel fold metal-dependent hydrolase
MLHRRSILKAALAAAALPALKLRAFAAKPPRRFVDVHCHFFNAADLPIRGFLQRVVLSDYNATQAQAASSISLGVWKGLTAKLTDVILRYEAPSIEQELTCLKDASGCSGYSASAAASHTRGLAKAMKSTAPGGGGGSARAKAIADALQADYSARSPSLEKGQTRGLQLKSDSAPSEQPLAEAPAASAPAPVAEAPGGNAPTGHAPAGNAEDTDAFVDFVLHEMQMKGAHAPGASSRSMKSMGSALSNAAEAIGGYLAGGKSVFSRYFAWGELLTSYRETIIETYYSLYDPQHTRIILTAPSIVDYNYWLNDQSPSPLPGQVELMSRLSLRQQQPMHGFVAFDPLREVRGKEGELSALAIAQEAVTKHGFLGVKLYSPMGFKPTGNAEKALTFPAYASQNDPAFGVALDKALDELYSWCEANEVPILAHTTDSQSAGPDYAGRAEPKFWERVLKKYPKLRLNLAHFGNFSQALGQNGAAKPYEKTWEYEISTYIKGGRYPNVYTDISYFYWVLDGSTAKDEVAAVKKFFASYFASDPHCERLMYGTDWNMTGRAAGAAQYLDNVEAFFRDVGLGEPQLDNLFYKNALRFLGLNRKGKQAERLKAFYAAAGKPYPSFA